MKDQFGRGIEYLRISVTDRCNFRCVYCMPEQGLAWLPKAEILSYEEITEVVRQLAPLGLRRLRITGGEPTIRPDLTSLVRMLKAIPDIEDIALSTNGVKLPEMAAPLRAAGLDRVNISADSLRPERIAQIARRNFAFHPVDAARAASAAGLDPVKMNVVIMRGINDDEIEDFARLTLENPWHVRFIELMPVGDMANLTFEHVVPSDELLARIAMIGTLAPSDLLGFASPLKFIFSHSALKEGWDNPNVFQICNFSTRATERWRRQTIGRGLRLCVNQDGVRLKDSVINTLTVIATESYQEFAENLQKDIEKETGIQFGVVPEHLFAVIQVTQADGTQVPLGFEASTTLADYLEARGYIDAKGKVQEALKKALKDDKLLLPPAFEPQRAQIAEMLRKASAKLQVKNADDRRAVPVRRAVLDSAEFKALWDRIKHKTTYRVQFDNEKLILDCIAALTDAPPITKTRLHWRKAGMAIGKAGVEATELAGADTVNLNESDIELPDVLTELQDRTQLTRRSIGRILTECRRLNDFKRNPQEFIKIAAEAINRCKRHALVDGIKYQRLGDDAYYAQALFEQTELKGYLENMLQDTEKSVYAHVVYDSDTERAFADQLEKNSAIKVYAKLPGWFRVPTPLGSYNPDWAVLVTTPEGDKLYFVVETKSSLLVDDLRRIEADKIKCGAAHFKALAVGENPATFGKYKDVAGLLAIASGD